MENYTIYIFIRHADKEYNNNRGFYGCNQHDPPIKKKYLNKIHQLGSNLTDNFGLPNMIIISPFLRVRQTALHLISNIDKKSQIKNLYIDKNISEYLGNHNGDILSIEPETKTYLNIHNVIKENTENLRHRVKQHLLNIQVYNKIENRLINTNKVVWIVTHGIIINFVNKFLKKSGKFRNCENYFYPDYLKGLIIKISNYDAIVEYF